MERIAQADEFEVVKEVEEIYGDFYAYSEYHFHFGIDSAIGDQLDSWIPKNLVRTSESLVATLLSLRKKPLIRYQV